LSPAMAGRDHAVTRRSTGFPHVGSAGGGGAAYGREGSPVPWRLWRTGQTF
jgi:hypothetical protein